MRAGREMKKVLSLKEEENDREDFSAKDHTENCFHVGENPESHFASEENPGDIPEGEEERLANEELLYELSELYKVFADETRIRILSALLDGEAGVGSLSARLRMSMSAVSHSLRILKGARLVRCRREGKSVFYSLCDDHVKMILLLGLDHVAE